MRIPFNKSSLFRTGSVFFCLLFLLVWGLTAALQAQTVQHVHTGHHVTAHHHAARRRRTAASPAHAARSRRAQHRVTAAAVRHRQAAQIERARLARTRRYTQLHPTTNQKAALNRVSSEAQDNLGNDPQMAQLDTPASAEDATVAENSASTNSLPANPVIDKQAVAASVRQTIHAATHVQPLIVPIPRVMPAPLRGSHDVLVHQNIIADVEGLSRIQNDAQIREMLGEKLLVALPVGSGLQVDPRLPANRRYCRPWAADFLSNISHEHTALFQRPLQVNSAVRTVQFQVHLERINGNAAPATGDTASPHLTGAAIDIAKKGMSTREVGWMREYLGRLQDQGKLDVEEEFQQACFHVSVYKTYEPSTYPLSLAPSRSLMAKADTPRVVAASSAPAHAVRHSARRRRHVSVSLLAARMR